MHITYSKKYVVYRNLHLRHIQNNIKILTIFKSSLTTNGFKLSLLSQSRQPTFPNTCECERPTIIALNNGLPAVNG